MNEENIRREDLSIITYYAKRIENSIAKRETSNDIEDIFSILQDFQKDVANDILHKIYATQVKAINDTVTDYASSKLRCRVYSFGTDSEVYAWLISQFESTLKETKKLAVEYSINIEVPK